jgi:hypothetical protein
MARLYHASITAVTFKGVQYDANESGVIEVPDEAASDLMRGFGFIVAPEAEAETEAGAETETGASAPAFIFPNKPISQWKSVELYAAAAHLGIEGADDMSRNEVMAAVSAALKAGS